MLHVGCMCVTYALHHMPGQFQQQQPVLLVPGLPVLRVPPGPPLMPHPDEQVSSTCDSWCMWGDGMCVTYALHHCITCLNGSAFRGATLSTLRVRVPCLIDTMHWTFLQQ